MAMIKRFRKWNRRRRFTKAYVILRKEADRHRKADHMVEFKAVNESYVELRCFNCPNLQP